ncbi:MAG: hypothetical protein DRN27_00010 [Thermoplasmata archaeon]|nr:MAG: hypothetical protein DRN27_00010 [Thermoplasmata archaeon]
MENYTKNGLLFIFLGLIVGGISSLIMFLYSFIITSQGTSGIFGMVGIGMFSGFGGLLTLVGGVFMLMGRKEFTKRHEEFITKAVVFLVLSIVSSMVIVIGSTVISAVSGSPNIYASSFLPALISSVLGGLVYVFALYELMDPKGRTLLYIAYIVSIGIALISSLYVLGLFGDVFGGEITTDLAPSAMNLVSSASKISVLGVVSSLLWAITAYIPFKRIKDGEIVAKIKTNEIHISKRICPNCSKNIPDDANICPYCGKQFESFL